MVPRPRRGGRGSPAPNKANARPGSRSDAPKLMATGGGTGLRSPLSSDLVAPRLTRRWLIWRVGRSQRLPDGQLQARQIPLDRLPDHRRVYSFVSMPQPISYAPNL